MSRYSGPGFSVPIELIWFFFCNILELTFQFDILKFGSNPLKTLNLASIFPNTYSSVFTCDDKYMRQVQLLFASANLRVAGGAYACQPL